MYDLHHIARSVLHQIREEHRITGYIQKVSTSHGPSIRPAVSSTLVCMQPIRGRGKGRVDRRGRGRDGGRGHGRDGEGGRGTPEPTLLTSIPPPPPPHTYPSPEIFTPPQTYTSPSIPPNVGFMCIKANISLIITIYIYCQLIRNLKGHTQKE